ncbi:GNAT family N-acetyltransferase [Phanerochaete sordida]|uniref:GNAT family N-acetyltransferase n=1 Tax=Phanerochaete sordida TaxID=48140 RepID=A0A9P3GCX1_9APHY|nr:GNAT family N-acetyltransferase [Phanerochaete sordida]
MYRNDFRAEPSVPVLPTDDLHETTPVAEYDLNSVIPPPPAPLKTDLVLLEPLVPALHGDALAAALSAEPAGDDPDVWFYPFPSGRPYKTREETFLYMEKQRRRANVLPFAIIDRRSGDFAGTMSLGCDPKQANLDVRLMSVKLLPRFRGGALFVHASFLLLAYALDPAARGGLGLVRVGWRAPPENTRSQRAAAKLGFAREGVQRCYEVSDASAVLLAAPYPHLRAAPDGTRRLTEDAVICALTVHDWLGPEDKRGRLEALCAAAQDADARRAI